MSLIFIGIFVFIFKISTEKVSFYCDKCSYKLAVNVRWIDEEQNKSIKNEENPYLDIFKEVKNLNDSFIIRGELTKYY